MTTHTAHNQSIYIGLDIGSVAVKAVILDSACRLLWHDYRRHKGRPYETAYKMLRIAQTEALTKTGLHNHYLAMTGISGKNPAHAMGVPFVNEVQAQASATHNLYPHIRTIIEVGGEDAKLITVSDTGTIKDFALNSACAAGTGSFLDQQAERLKLTIEEFSKTAYLAEKPSSVAGRCSVFAKSDMIHLQQIATPLPNIVAGLCYAVARNFKSTIAKSKEITQPVSFHGGVASNEGMVRAFAETLGIDRINVPAEHALMTAIGAITYANAQHTATNFDLDTLRRYAGQSQTVHLSHPRLPRNGHMQHTNEKTHRQPQPSQKKITDGYLGIDVGSISTNLAVIDDKGTVIAKRYLMTAGNPIEAVRTGLIQIGQEIGQGVRICAVGTTGSGRYMIADYVGADTVKNEITAQATAAIFIDPAVDTVFEIGGQDSKYISLRDRTIVDFEMNKACAAGTGSFLEEQAEKLDISVENEFATAAFSSQSPCKLGERCTVFMENSIATNLSNGATKSDLLAGLAYSIVQNYITKVVGNKKIGQNIFFQGGVAFNKSVVSAFEGYLGTRITVPPHHDVTGAIGMALIARDDIAANPRVTTFKGFSLAQSAYDISSFDCKNCPNLCQINRVRIHGEKKMLFYGSRCEKYDHDKKAPSDREDLFAFRDEALWQAHNRNAAAMHDPTKPTIGLPYIFALHDTLPFWSTFLWQLGFNVKTLPKTNSEIIKAGTNALMTESCFPVKAANGHISTLIASGVDAMFVPSFVSLSQDSKFFESSFSCPLTQAMPYSAKGTNKGTAFITPAIHMARGEHAMFNELLTHLKQFGITKKEMTRALGYAIHEQDTYEHTMLNKGDQVLKSITENTIAIIGRSYNALDQGMNLAIPTKLARLGVTSIPMDMIRTNPQGTAARCANMYWRSGQKILTAANAIATQSNLYPIYISNFLCGPDSFIIKYLPDELNGKPFLNIEIDEHTADAGVMTRCEAFLDSLGNAKKIATSTTATTPRSHKPKTAISKRLYIPHMSDHCVLAASAFKRCGIDAVTMPESDSHTIDAGRKYVSGKECYPYLLTTGDMVKCLNSDGFNPENATFLMPSGSGPCRFGQYNICHSAILSELGHPQISVLTPAQDWRLYKQFSSYAKDIPARSWQAIVAADLLIKHLHQNRPYETNKGDTDAIYEKHLAFLSSAIANPHGNIEAALTQMSKDFSSIAKKTNRKPIIGLIGEVYVRNNRFANNDLIRKIEDLGMQVHLSPLSEWIHYIGFTGSRKARHRGDIMTSMGFLLRKYAQNNIEEQYRYACRKGLKNSQEPSIGRILKSASTYIHDSLEGEAILSIGRGIEFALHGTAGIINLMPFGCMPSSIVAALLRCITRDYGIPHISIAYDGTESHITQIQIEAFAAQAKSYHQERKKKETTT